MKTFKDIEVGDVVVVYDSESSHDYIEHTMEVTSIEYDEDYVTKTNPTGMHCYGNDLDYEEDEEGYITHIHEGNFVCFESDLDRLEIR